MLPQQVQLSTKMISALYYGCAYRGKKRKHNGREKAGAVTISMDFLQELWEKQKGRCALSGLDRMDNEKGYVEDNIRLVCQEFQHTSAWTQTKWEEARTLS